jgi:hypothetical protein
MTEYFKMQRRSHKDRKAILKKQEGLQIEGVKERLGEGEIEKTWRLRD